MARTKDEGRRALIVGACVIGFGFLGVVAIGVSQTKGLFKDKVTVTADFRQISGLKPGSPVQLEGIEIGQVVDRQFVELEYTCNPLTEDRGRFGHGRTDDCDRTLFCAPEGKCAELEPYSFNKDLHPPCEQDDQCGEMEVCVNADFRRRYRRVAWVGNAGVCDGYTTDHKRIRVSMEVYAERLQHLREDSRATISQNGVLGDQLIQVSGGRGKQIAAGGQLQTIPAMIEELDNVKDRADGLFDKVEATIGGVAELAKAMGDEKVVKDVQNLLADANDRTRRTAEGQGTFGELINDETYTKDFNAVLRNVREGAAGLDRGLGNAKAGLNSFEKDLEPAVKTGRDAMAKIHFDLAATRNPESTTTLALLIGDREGRLTRDVEDTLAGANRLVTGINAGEGTAGRFLTDPKGYDDLVRFFKGLQDRTAIKILVKWARWKDSRDPRIRRKAD
jgi:ABC-type transporter Mla subunit MlaD